MTNSLNLHDRLEQYRAISAIIADSFKYEPLIKLDFSLIELETLVPTLFALFDTGYEEVEEVVQYLHDRRCAFDRATIDFIIDMYEGDVRDHCLWRRFAGGRYITVL